MHPANRNAMLAGMCFSALVCLLLIAREEAPRPAGGGVSFEEPAPAAPARGSDRTGPDRFPGPFRPASDYVEHPPPRRYHIRLDGPDDAFRATGRGHFRVTPTRAFVHIPLPDSAPARWRRAIRADATLKTVRLEVVAGRPERVRFLCPELDDALSWQLVAFPHHLAPDREVLMAESGDQRLLSRPHLFGELAARIPGWHGYVVMPCRTAHAGNTVYCWRAARYGTPERSWSFESSTVLSDDDLSGRLRVVEHEVVIADQDRERWRLRITDADERRIARRPLPDTLRRQTRLGHAGLPPVPANAARLRPYVEDPRRLLALLRTHEPREQMRRHDLVHELRAWIELDPSIARPLVAYLDGLHGRDRALWMILLGRLPGNACRRRLEAAVRDAGASSGMRISALRALAQGGDAARRRTPERRMHGVLGDTDPHPETVLLLGDLLTDEDPALRAATYAFARSYLHGSGRRNPPELAAFVRKIEAIVLSAGKADRDGAIRVLGSYRGSDVTLTDATVEQLRRLIPDSAADVETRCSAIKALHYAADAPTELLLGVARHDPEDIVRREAIGHLRPTAENDAELLALIRSETGRSGFLDATLGQLAGRLGASREAALRHVAEHAVRATTRATARRDLARGTRRR